MIFMGSVHFGQILHGHSPSSCYYSLLNVIDMDIFKTIWPMVESHIAWLLGAEHILLAQVGNSTLASLFPHQHHTIQVHDFFNDSGWNFDNLLQVLPPTMIESIGRIPLCSKVPDRICEKTPDGKFATESAWQLVHSRLPPFVLVTMARAITRQCVHSTTDWLSLASRCQCYQRLKHFHTYSQGLVYRTRFGITLLTQIPLKGVKKFINAFRDSDTRDSLFNVSTFALSFLCRYFGLSGLQGMMQSTGILLWCLVVSFGGCITLFLFQVIYFEISTSKRIWPSPNCLVSI